MYLAEYADKLMLLDGASRADIPHLKDFIEYQLKRPFTDLKLVVVTHMHPDHVLGAGPMAEGGAAVVGHAGLTRALADRQANYRDSLSRLIGVEAFLGTGIAPVCCTATMDQ